MYMGDPIEGQARLGQARTVKCYNCNGGPDNAFDDDVDEQPIQDLALNVDNVFQAKECDAFDSDVDEAPTAQTMFMANLSSVDPITDEAGPSYDSDILFEEETLKWELHSTKLQLTSTINRNKSMVEETTFLKQDFKQKENKLLADFLNMRSLKEKVED
nr:integrase, catalytic region, zinc finger, CCHC-type, peptidase aspartic, catalytic [Tanacetum cinerariifolium]